MSHPAQNISRARSAVSQIMGSVEGIGIYRIDLFGSRACGDDRPDSDWDILVYFSRPICREECQAFHRAIASSIGGRVDLHSPMYAEEDFIFQILPTCQNIYDT